MGLGQGQGHEEEEVVRVKGCRYNHVILMERDLFSQSRVALAVVSERGLSSPLTSALALADLCSFSPARHPLLPLPLRLLSVGLSSGGTCG